MRVVASTVAAIVFSAGSALAGLNATTGPNLVSGTPGSYTPRDASGIFGARMAVFSSAGGAFYDDNGGGAGVNLQNFGVNESMGLFAGRDIRIQSSMSSLANGDQLIVISSFTADTNPFVAPGTTLGGQLINAIQFDIGTPNAPADPIDFNSNIVVVSATFTVSSASTTFGPFAATTTTPGGNSLTSRSGVNGGADITTFGINRFDVTIEITKVPAPGALALFGLGSLALTRRRR